MAEITARALRTIADQIEAGWYAGDLHTLHVEADGASGKVKGCLLGVDPDSLDDTYNDIEVAS